MRADPLQYFRFVVVSGDFREGTESNEDQIVGFQEIEVPRIGEDELGLAVQSVDFRSKLIELFLTRSVSPDLPC